MACVANVDGVLGGDTVVLNTGLGRRPTVWHFHLLTKKCEFDQVFLVVDHILNFARFAKTRPLGLSIILGIA